MEQRRLGLLFTVLAAALFGTLGIFGKLAVEVELSVTTLLSTRFVAATALLWGLLLVDGRLGSLPRRAIGVELGLGVVYGIMSVTYFESLAWLSAGVAALLLFTYPIQVTMASGIVLEEPVTITKLLALVAAISGVALVVVGGAQATAPLGLLLVGVASCCYTVYTMGTRAVIEDVDPLVHVGYVFLGVSVTILGYGLATGSLTVPATAASWWLIAGITLVGTVAPVVLFTEGLARVEASRASIVSTSEPLTTVLLGVVFLDEAFTLSIAAGALLILIAVVVASSSVEQAIRRRLSALGTGARIDQDR